MALTAKLRVESYAASITARRLVDDAVIVSPTRRRSGARPVTPPFFSNVTLSLATIAPHLVTFRDCRDASGRAPVNEDAAVDDMIVDRRACVP